MSWYARAIVRIVFGIMAPRHLPIRTAHPARTGWLRPLPVVRRAGGSDLTLVGPACGCGCVFAAGECDNLRYLYLVPPGFSARTYTPWEVRARAAARIVSIICLSAW